MIETLNTVDGPAQGDAFRRQGYALARKVTLPGAKVTDFAPKVTIRRVFSLDTVNGVNIPAAGRLK